jgi:hypothetical protein
VAGTILGAHRAVIEGLLAGLGFTPCPEDSSLEKLDSGALERRFEVHFLPQETLDGQRPNTSNASGLYKFPFRVRIAYVVTGAGASEAERGGEQSGAATPAAVEDRFATDLNRLAYTVGRQAPFAGLDPAVIDCRPMPGATADMPSSDRVIVSIPFEIWARVTVPGSYHPTV